MNTKHIALIIVLLSLPTTIHAQDNDDKMLKIPAVLRSVEPYGTFQYAFGGNQKGWAVVDLIPRVGLKGEWKIDNGNKYYFFTTAELGLSLTKRNDYVSISSDPGSNYGKVHNTVFARKGLIGIGTPFGRISIGKQWGVHYALAGNIDNMYMFGGSAIGVYNADTDGGHA
ncbi:MAG: porin [Bacteroidota bacterium]